VFTDLLFSIKYSCVSHILKQTALEFLKKIKFVIKFNFNSYIGIEESCLKIEKPDCGYVCWHFTKFPQVKTCKILYVTLNKMSVKDYLLTDVLKIQICWMKTVKNRQQISPSWLSNVGNCKNHLISFFRQEVWQEFSFQQQICLLAVVICSSCCKSVIIWDRSIAQVWET
jgi:hypothetical protein